jgi:hypothetical protein
MASGLAERTITGIVYDDAEHVAIASLGRQRL